MKGGWRYRVAGVVGTAVLTATAVAVVNNAVVVDAVGGFPLLGRLPADPPRGAELVFEMLTATAVVVVAFVPLFKPRPRRILDVVSLAQKRVLLAVVVLAAIGYFDYTYRLPRLTVLLATPLLLALLPAWFVYIRRRPAGESRAIVVGDDPARIAAVVEETSIPLVGYLSPAGVVPSWEGAADAVADGGIGIPRIGGLSRIDDVLVTHEVDTAFLAFSEADRAEFFGALDACYEHGVTAKVHREHADSVLTSGRTVGTFVDVEIEPWDLQDYMVKRGFDVAFAGLGLLALLPVMAAVALAIKLDDGGPVLYRQERTAVLGETFYVYKFRTMDLAPESPEPVDDDENPRITRFGRFLRRTHLDEIPQLWSILVGDMSVVGPRAVWTQEESLLEEESSMWRKRWFVKPGLTGLAQVHDAKSTDPQEKLRLDLEYVRRQSLRLDLKIVIRQLWIVGMEVVGVWRGTLVRED